MSEQKRGCGYRKIGGLYLVSDPGQQLACDGLPLELEPCGCCGFFPPFSRNLQKISAQYLFQAEEKKHKSLKECKCPPACPLCNPNPQGVYGLMYVGQKSYTASSFVSEAFKMGVSKRIPEIPSWLRLGEAWVFMACKKTPNMPLSELKENKMFEAEPEMINAIFYGFKPQRIEMPVWKDYLTDAEILKLEEKGITPVLLEKTPQNLKRHKDAKNCGEMLKRLLREDEK